MNIKLDKRNYRKHDEKNKKLIEKSLKECGTGRSIVIDNDNEIIAGNGVFEASKNLNIPTKIIETNGQELIVIKRTDLKTEDEKRKQLAVMDNSTSDTSTFDFELLADDFEIETLEDWGVELENIEIDNATLNDFNEGIMAEKYTKKIDTPVYEPTGELPNINSLCDTTQYDEYKEKIKNAQIPNEVKDFLYKALTRLYAFNYKAIAEFYAHQDKEIQSLMELLALVIIDIDDAIANGYVKLTQTLNDIRQSEKGINDE